MNYLFASDLPFENFCRLVKQVETITYYQKQGLLMIKHCLRESQKLTPHQSREVCYISFLYKTKQKLTPTTSASRYYSFTALNLSLVFEPKKLIELKSV